MPSQRRSGWEAWWLSLLLLAAFLLRLPLALLAPSPGIADPTYYFNLATNLAGGRGLTDDLIWHFHHLPADVTHPSDYYPPLTAILCAAAMRVGGGSLAVTLVPSVVLGALALPLLAYLVAVTLGLERGTGLFAAAVVASLPELVLNSVRTDTTILFAALAGLSLWWMGGWLAAPADGRAARRLALAGAAAGLAYLTRLDAVLLPATLLVTFAVAAWRKSPGVRVRELLWFAAPMLAVAAPWLIRNRIVLGTVFPIELGRTMFVTNVLDLFSSGGTFTLASYLAWGPDNILGKIAFEALGNAKMVILLLAAFAPIVLAAVALRVARPRSEPGRWLPLLPAGVFLSGVFVYYSAFAPFLSQSGSFKKAAMALLPFAAVAGAWALEELVPNARARLALAAAVVAVLVFQAVDLVRTDFRRTAAYEAMLAPARAAITALGDANGDGRLVVMTQDPFELAYHGMKAVMIPNDDRDTILAVASRYAVDYLLFPADRPALDPVQYGEEEDPRLRLAWHDPRSGMALYQFSPPHPLTFSPAAAPPPQTPQPGRSSARRLAGGERR